MPQQKNAAPRCCACGVEFTGREQKEQKERDGRLDHVFEAVDATLNQRAQAHKHGVGGASTASRGASTAQKAKEKPDV